MSVIFEILVSDPCLREIKWPAQKPRNMQLKKYNSQSVRIANGDAGNKAKVQNKILTNNRIKIFK